MVRIGFCEIDEVRSTHRACKESKEHLCLTQRPGWPEEAGWKSETETETERDTPHRYPVRQSGFDSRHVGLWEAAVVHPVPRIQGEASEGESWPPLRWHSWLPRETGDPLRETQGNLSLETLRSAARLVPLKWLTSARCWVPQTASFYEDSERKGRLGRRRYSPPKLSWTNPQKWCQGSCSRSWRNNFANSQGRRAWQRLLFRDRTLISSHLLVYLGTVCFFLIESSFHEKMALLYHLTTMSPALWMLHDTW